MESPLDKRQVMESPLDERQINEIVVSLSRTRSLGVTEKLLVDFHVKLHSKIFP